MGDKMSFTGRDCSTIRCGLECAVEEYRKLANTPTMNPRLARQFEDQATDAQKIIDRIDQEGW